MKSYTSPRTEKITALQPIAFAQSGAFDLVCDPECGGSEDFVHSAPALPGSAPSHCSLMDCWPITVVSGSTLRVSVVPDSPLRAEILLYSVPGGFLDQASSQNPGDTTSVLRTNIQPGNYTACVLDLDGTLGTYEINITTNGQITSTPGAIQHDDICSSACTICS